MPYFQRSDKLSIFYLDDGPTSAPTIVTLHGSACDLHDWNWQVPLLRGLGYRVITPDLRGHGKSSAPKPTPNVTIWPRASDPNADISGAGVVDYYPQTIAEDVISLLDHLSVTRAIFMGHSVGASSAMYLAATYPARVAACISLDPVHSFTNAQRDANVGNFNPPDTVNLKFAAMFQKYCYGTGDKAPAPWHLEWHRRRTLSMDGEVSLAAIIGAFENKDALGRKENAVAVLHKNISCPRLTVASSEFYISVDREYLSEGGDSDEALVLDGYGHWFHQFASERFNEILRAWLEKAALLPEKIVDTEAAS